MFAHLLTGHFSFTFPQIIDIQRPVEVPQQGLLCDILWSDPDRVRMFITRIETIPTSAGHYKKQFKCSSRIRNINKAKKYSKAPFLNSINYKMS